METIIKTANLFVIAFLALECLAQPTQTNEVQVRFRYETVNNVSVFYRESGIPYRPAILLLHGFPSSSHMFRNLMKELASDYYVIAPDYPGFGFSDSPALTEFDYTFDNISIIIEKLIKKIGLKQVYLYVHDYGGPVGFRIAQRNPKMIAGFIIQNANAYSEGFGAVTQDFQNYFQNPNKVNEEKVKQFLTLAGTRFHYLDGAGDSSQIAPESWILDYALLTRPGNDELQLALFRDYISNVKAYSGWHAYFRQYQPQALIVWGKNDKIFTAKGATAYKKDLPEAENHLLEGGHFVLEEEYYCIASLIKEFINKQH
jgi:pimeloyl-ACP methyl ester carboxylesterase